MSGDAPRKLEAWASQASVSGWKLERYCSQSSACQPSRVGQNAAVGVATEAVQPPGSRTHQWIPALGAGDRTGRRRVVRACAAKHA